MDKKNIIIVGYPKSGTTWLSRLTAELISCPLIGDWGFDSLDAPYQEGLSRSSNYQIYKSHYLFNEIKNASDQKIHKIIYIIRDPRDIVISGMHYFTFYPKYLVHDLLMKSSIGRKVISKLVPEKEKKKEMIKAVLLGNKAVNPWLSNSWKSHYETYSHKNVLFVKFEDLLQSPIEEINRILHYLEIPVSNAHLKESMYKQSFKYRKQMDAHKKDHHQKKILRTGKSGYWKNEFSEHEKGLFKKSLESSFYTF